MAQPFTLARLSRLASARALAIIGMTAGVASMSGCKLDNALGPSNAQAVVQFINAAPGYTTADLYVDNVDALAGLPYGQGSSILVTAPTTPRLFQIRGGTDTTTLASNQLLVTDQATYTLILTQHPTGAGLITLPDTVTGTPANSLGLRLVNAAPTAGTVDVYITGADSALADANPVASSVPFEGVSNYQYFPSGPVVRLRVTNAGTKTVLLDVDASALSTGQVRTIVMIDNTGGGLPLTWLGLGDLG